MKKNIDPIIVKEKLIKRRQELVSDTAIKSDFSEGVGQVNDVGDEANLLSMQKLQISLTEADFNEIRLIDRALEQINEGAYGICIDCEGEISHTRLEYYPYALRCIVCQEASEK